MENLEIKNPKPVIIGNEEFGYLWEVWEEEKLLFRFFSEGLYNSMWGGFELVESGMFYSIDTGSYYDKTLNELEEFCELIANNSANNVELRNQRPVICGDIFGYVCELCLKGQEKVLLNILVEEDDSLIFVGSTYGVKGTLSRTGIDKFFKNN